MIVNSNTSSLFSRRAIGGTTNAVDVASRRLSSGLRINSAADDAAGLSISERMSTQVNGQGQARRNVNDGVSMLQTAEGVLQQSTDLLQRIRQLTVQAANGTYSAQDRAAIQAEVDSLVYEFDRVSADAEFNSRKLLDGSNLSTSLHVGYRAKENVNLDIRSTRASDLYSYEMSGEVATNNSLQAAQTATSDGSATQRNRLQTQNLAINARNLTGAVVLQAGLSAQEVASRINQALVGKQGLVSARAETYALISLSGTQSANIDFKLNGVGIQAFSNQTNTDMEDLVRNINDASVRTGITATTQTLAGGGTGILLHALQGEDIKLSQVSITLANNATGTMGVQGVYEQSGSFGSAGAAVSLTGGGATSGRNTTVGGRLLITSDAAYTISHSATGSSGGLFAYNPNILVSSSKGGNLWDADVTSTQASNRTLGLVDAVLARVSTYRTTLGAMQNRLDFTRDNLSSSVENASAARSRTRDADFAEETSDLAKVQLVRQAGVSMLAQANVSANRALDLLK